MRTTVAITLRKDLWRTWPLLALLYGALAAWVVLLQDPPPFEVVQGEVDGQMWHVWWIMTLGSLWHLIGMIAAGWAVLDDPPAGGEPFWATRPLSRDGLLLAKLLFLTGALWLPMALSRSIVASSLQPEWALLQAAWGSSVLGDLLILGVAALLAGFAASLRAWVRLVVGFFVVVYVAWGAVGVLYVRWLSAPLGLLRPAGVLVLLVLGAAILWWRYRRLGLPGWVESPVLRPRRTRGRRRERAAVDRPRPRRARRLFSETLHHLRKDLVRIWPAVAALVLLLAYRLNELLPAEALAAEPVLEGSWTSFHRTWLKSLVLLAVGLAVFEDPPLGRDPFWATRPVRPSRLAAAKGAFACGFVLLPVLGAEAVALVAYGLDPGRLPAALGEAALSMAATVAAAVAISMLVQRMIVWLVVLIMLPVIEEIAIGVPALVLRLFLEPQYGSLTAWILGASIALALAGLLLVAAYRRLRTRATLTLAGAGFAVYVFVFHFWPWDFLQPWLQYRGTPRMAAAGEVAVEAVEPQTRLTGWGSLDPGVPVQVKIAARGLPTGVAFWGDVEAGRLTGASGGIDAGRGSVWFGDREAWQAALGEFRRLDEWPDDRDRRPEGHATLLYLSPEEFERLAGRPASWRGRLRLVPYRYVEHAEIPFAEAAGARLRRGSYETLVLEANTTASRPGFRGVERDFVLRFDGNGWGMRSWIAGTDILTNARRGEAIPIDNSRSGGAMMMGLKGSSLVALEGVNGLPLVTPAPWLQQTTFEHHGDYRHWRGDRPDRAWFDDATLLRLKRIEGRPFEVELAIEDLVLRREDLESWMSSRKDSLEDQRERSE